MQRLFRFKGYRHIQQTYVRKLPILLACVLLFGVCAGTVTQSWLLHVQNTYLSFFAQQTLDLYRNPSFVIVASRFFISCFLLHTVALFCSFSCVGAPCLWGVLFLKGVYTGILSTSLYAQYGVQGLLINLLLFWIPDVWRSICLILFLTPALQASNYLFCTHILEKGAGNSGAIQRVQRVFLATAMLYLPCSVLVGVLSIVFAPVLLV